MTITIRAVVENGALRPLEPVDLVEGQEVEVIITEPESAVAGLDNQMSLFAAANDEGLL